MTLNRTTRQQPVPQDRATTPIPAPAQAPEARSSGCGLSLEMTTDDPPVNGPDAQGPDAQGPAAHRSRLRWARALRGAVDVVYREMVKFGAVGAIAYVIDLYVYNLLRTGVWPVADAPLAHKPLLSKVISVAVATVVAWVGNRYWTFRHRRRAAIQAEFVLFVVMNLGGLLISVGCLWFSHYVLGLKSVLADNISGNMVGLVLGTLFRFWAYRQFVFTEMRETSPDGGQVSPEPKDETPVSEGH